MTTPATPAPSAYARKLNDPRWLRKKLAILSRDGNHCKFCRSSVNPLQVRFVAHRGLNPWDYPDDELETVCVDCAKVRSEAIDDAINQVRVLIKDVPNIRLEQVLSNIIHAAKVSR